MKQKRISAFTLIEVVIVIALLAILALVGLVTTQPAERFDDAKDTVRRTEAEALAKAVRVYYLDNGFVYPVTNSNGSIAELTRTQFQDLIDDAQTGTVSCQGTPSSELSNALSQDYFKGSLLDPDSNPYYIFRVEDLFVVSCTQLSTGEIYARVE